LQNDKITFGTPSIIAEFYADGKSRLESTIEMAAQNPKLGSVMVTDWV